MKLELQRLGGWIAIIALATTAIAAADNPTTSAEKARQAVSVLQSAAPAADKAIACKRLAVYGTADAVPALASLLPDKELASAVRKPGCS